MFFSLINTHSITNINSVIINRKSYTYPFNPLFLHHQHRKNFYYHCNAKFKQIFFLNFVILTEYLASAVIVESSNPSVGHLPIFPLSVCTEQLFLFL